MNSTDRDNKTEGGAPASRKVRAKRVLLIIGVTLLVVVGALKLCDRLGFRFYSRLAVCYSSDGRDHWRQKHENPGNRSDTPCAGVVRQTDDFDFYFAYSEDENGDPAWANSMSAAKRYGFLYRNARCDSAQLLYDENGEPAFNLIVYKGREKNYYRIRYLSQSAYVMYNGRQEWQKTENVHVGDSITVNGETVDLYLRVFFEYEGEIDTIVLQDGTVVHPQTCRTEDCVYSLPDIIETAIPQTPDTEP